MKNTTEFIIEIITEQANKENDMFLEKNYFPIVKSELKKFTQFKSFSDEMLKREISVAINYLLEVLNKMLEVPLQEILNNTKQKEILDILKSQEPNYVKFRKISSLNIEPII